jgi:glutamyl-Q tRNA(Asp) synthetase
MSARPVFRFAPSPNGWLHAGHARSALLNHRLARRFSGVMLLRIEDIDQTRSREEFVTGLIEDLRWLGLSWPVPALRQSARYPLYLEAATRLFDKGLLYPCGCSRADIRRASEALHGDAAPHDPDGAPIYPGTCRPRAGASPSARRPGDPGPPVAWRLDMAAARRLFPGPVAWRTFTTDGGTAPASGDPALWGDVPLLRREFPASYHLAVVVDDAAQGVTHVVRGTDLSAATSLHRLLQALLDLPAPVWHHHPLLLDRDGAKLSKSKRSESLRKLRAEGVDPVALAAEVLASLLPSG